MSDISRSEAKSLHEFGVWIARVGLVTAAIGVLIAICVMVIATLKETSPIGVAILAGVVGCLLILIGALVQKEAEKELGL